MRRLDEQEKMNYAEKEREPNTKITKERGISRDVEKLTYYMQK